jgi:putative two-component system response regulator
MRDSSNPYLFDHARAATLGWKSAAVEVAQRERDGMVALARGAEAKDTDTGDHVVRVQVLASELALSTGLGASQAADIGWSAMLHDVGKLHVPDRILLKPGPLTAEEWVVLRRHPVRGAEISRERVYAVCTNAPENEGVRPARGHPGAGSRSAR